MIGKKKCEILKEIRQKIADENEIPYKTRECTHKGPCSGTCPYCESEVRYLENQLNKRKSLGKPVKIAAVAAGIALAVSGCSVFDRLAGMPVPVEPTLTPVAEILDGEVPLPEHRSDPDPDPLPTVTTNTQVIETDITGYLMPEEF